jgi:hypothetical protein
MLAGPGRREQRMKSPMMTTAPTPHKAAGAAAAPGLAAWSAPTPSSRSGEPPDWLVSAMQPPARSPTGS